MLSSTCEINEFCRPLTTKMLTSQDSRQLYSVILHQNDQIEGLLTKIADLQHTVEASQHRLYRHEQKTALRYAELQRVEAFLATSQRRAAACDDFVASFERLAEVKTDVESTPLDKYLWDSTTVDMPQVFRGGSGVAGSRGRYPPY